MSKVLGAIVAAALAGSLLSVPASASGSGTQVEFYVGSHLVATQENASVVPRKGDTVRIVSQEYYETPTVLVRTVKRVQENYMNSNDDATLLTVQVILTR